MSILNELTATITEMKNKPVVPIGIALGYLTLAALRFELGKIQMVKDPNGPKVDMLSGLQISVLAQPVGHALLYAPNDAAKLILERELARPTPTPEAKS